ncbi:MAG: DUF362 domain-containing protein [Candidatus Obscuribacterales bacterium]|nr:DUF362 domain-containing protein [Candidatus Obscuribacterales bacterium]
MSENEEHKTTRRVFIQGASGFLAGAASLSACASSQKLPEPDSRQRSLKKQGRSSVHIAKASSYEALSEAMPEAWEKAGLQVSGKSVFLKINLVDYRGEIPVYTNPAFVRALIQELKKAGATEIKVGDGPALRRDTHEIASMAGFIDLCAKEHIQFVDLNLDDLEKVENRMNFTGVPEFLLPLSITKSDLVISVPKLKTHHWALMTASMKNLFGVIPGRKYGWPKNLLHVKEINSSILDIVCMVKPSFAAVDAVIAMEGDGPLDGKAKSMNAFFLGEDLVAVDTVCALSMNLPADKIRYLRLAGQVWGNNNLADIDLSGLKIDDVKQSFELPPTFEKDGSAKDFSVLTEGSESGVT